MESFKPYLAKVATRAALSREEARAAFDTLLSGEVTPAQGGGFLMALRVRGEALDEIAGAADVLTALGVKIGLDPAVLERCLAEAKLCFMFAQTHHASMRHVGPVRVELGTRTLFNLLGPLSNPAGVDRQLLGVPSATWLEPLTQVLKELGSRRVWTVHGSDGLDEITTTGPSTVVALEDGAIRRFTIHPEEVGLERAEPDELKGGEPARNAGELRAVLDGG